MKARSARTCSRAPPDLRRRASMKAMACECIPRVKGSPGSNPAVPTVFRTLVPRNGNETGHDHSHLTGRDERSIQDGGHAILMTALSAWPRSPGAAGRLGICLPTAGAGGLDQHVMAEQLAPAAEPVAGVQTAQTFPCGRRTHRP